MLSFTCELRGAGAAPCGAPCCAKASPPHTGVSRLSWSWAPFPRSRCSSEALFTLRDSGDDLGPPGSTHPPGGEQIAGFAGERRSSYREKQTGRPGFGLTFLSPVGLEGCRAAWSRLGSTIVLILHSLSKHSLQTLGMFLFCYVAETFYVVYIVLMEHGVFLKATYNTHFCVCVLPGVNKTITLMTFLQLQTVVSPLLRCFLVNLWLRVVNS